MLWIASMRKAAYPACEFAAHIPVDRREKETPPMLRVIAKPSDAHQELRITLDEVL